MKFKHHISIKSVLWTLLFAGTVLMILMSVRHKSGGLLRGVEVEIRSMTSGNHLLTAADVLAELEAILGPVKRLQEHEVDLHELEDILYYNPFIRDAHVFITADHTLKVRVDERQPVLRIFEQGGDSYYLDNSGVCIPVSPHYTARVAVASGRIPRLDPRQEIAGQKTFADLYALIQYVHEDAFLEALVEQIYVEKEGEYVLIPKIGHTRIRIGDTGRLQDKLENLKIFYTHGLPKAGWEKYREINLEFKDQVVCTKRNITS